MPRSPKQQSLIEQLERVLLLDGRFKDILCVNCDPVGERQGVTALVFSAIDIVEDAKVAIKFLDPELLGDTYRTAAFEREPEILRQLARKKRCLNLVSGMSEFGWEIDLAGTKSSFPMKYFPTNWLDIDIEPFFVSQDKYSSLEKLNIFRSAVLAVDSFHSEGISHRDIKSDNFRGFIEEGETVAVVIDFGTAAHYDTPLATSSLKYPSFSVGAPAFSSPETLAGFSSYRYIGHLTDIYALGALLYQLFNPEIFAIARGNNKHFEQILMFLKAKLGNGPTFEDKSVIWSNEIKPFRFVLEPPKMDSMYHTIPSSIINILAPLHKSMTLFDYNDRIDNLQFVIRKIDCAIKVLSNEKLDTALALRRQIKRQQRIDKIKYKEEKLIKYLKLKNQLELK
jgi:serine/threonine protein kinase